MSDPAPFELPVHVRTLPKLGRRERYVASEAVREAIANAYDLIGVERFDANMIVQPWKSRGVRMEGSVRAALLQPCAATGDPLAVTIDERFERIFVPDGSKLAKPRIDDSGEMVLDPEGDDAPEPFAGDTIDLAAVWLEHFALALDPFARADDAPDVVVRNDEGEPSPFAALAALKLDSADD